VWIFLNVGTDASPELAAGKRLEVEGKPVVGGSLKIGEGEPAPGEPYAVGRDGKKLRLVKVPGHPAPAEQYTKIHLADWNGDGRPDLLVGHSDGVFLLYPNRGTKEEPVFGLPEKVELEGGQFPSRPSPFLFDWDGDGKRDLIVGTEDGRVWFYANTGTDTAPRFSKAEGKRMQAGGKPLQVGHRARLTVTDWNNDGVPDLLVGDFYSKPAQEKGQRGESGGNVWLFLGKSGGEDEF
jgi:hypothetical protein